MDWEYDDQKKHLLEILERNDFEILKAAGRGLTSEATDSTSLAQSLHDIYLIENRSQDLLQSLISDEVNRTTKTETLFRGTSIATKLLTLFGEHIGRNFIRTGLAPIVDIIEDEVAVEIDPIRIRQGDPDVEVKKGIEVLTEVLTQLVDSITKTRVPALLCDLACHLSFETEKVFPKMGTIAVGSWIFLRLLCPAIFNPSRSGLSIHPGIESASLRTRVLIAKVLQNLASQVEFGHKEDYMVAFNPFLKKHGPTINTFLNSLAQPRGPPAEEFFSPPPVTRHQALASQAIELRLWHLLWTHRKKVSDELSRPESGDEHQGFLALIAHLAIVPPLEPDLEHISSRPQFPPTPTNARSRPANRRQSFAGSPQATPGRSGVPPRLRQETPLLSRKAGDLMSPIVPVPSRSNAVARGTTTLAKSKSREKLGVSFANRGRKRKAEDDADLTSPSKRRAKEEPDDDANDVMTFEDMLRTPPQNAAKVQAKKSIYAKGRSTSTTFLSRLAGKTD